MQAICNPQTFHCHPISYRLCCWLKKTPNKQKNPKLFYKTSIYTHHLLELLKTSTVSHLHHRKPTAVGDSISPVIMTLQLLAQHCGFHSCLIQLCCHIFFSSYQLRTLPPELSLPQAANHTRSSKPLMTALLHPSTRESVPITDIIWKQPNLEHPQLKLLISTHTCCQSSLKTFRMLLSSAA